MKWLQAEYDNLTIQTSDVPKDLISEIKQIQKDIPKDLLKKDNDEKGWVKDGKQELFHITLLYGIEESDAKEIEDFLKDTGPIEITANKIDYFDNSDEDENVVLKVNCESKGLKELHDKLKEKFENTHRNDFKPHVTVAYISTKLPEDIELSKDYTWTINTLEISMNGGKDLKEVKLNKKKESYMKWEKESGMEDNWQPTRPDFNELTKHTEWMQGIGQMNWADLDEPELKKQFDIGNWPRSKEEAIEVIKQSLFANDKQLKKAIMVFDEANENKIRDLLINLGLWT